MSLKHMILFLLCLVTIATAQAMQAVASAPAGNTFFAAFKHALEFATTYWALGGWLLSELLAVLNTKSNSVLQLVKNVLLKLFQSNQNG